MLGGHYYFQCSLGKGAIIKLLGLPSRSQSRGEFGLILCRSCYMCYVDPFRPPQIYGHKQVSSQLLEALKVDLLSRPRFLGLQDLLYYV
jgi:hypothetical protein